MEASLFFLYLWGKLEHMAQFLWGEEWGLNLGWKTWDLSSATQATEALCCAKPTVPERGSPGEDRKCVDGQLLGERAFPAGIVDAEEEFYEHWETSQRLHFHHCSERCYDSQTFLFSTRNILYQVKFGVEPHKYKTEPEKVLRLKQGVSVALA